jgi:hypothetical protein
MSNADRRRLVSFAYGRSRLPRTANEMVHKFKISLLSGSGRADEYLIKGHSCFSTWMVEPRSCGPLVQCV